MSSRPKHWTPKPWTTICALALCMGVCGLALGLSYPLFSLVLARSGTGDFLNGVSGAMTGLGLLTSNFAVPALLRRFGARRTLILSLAGTAACLALAPFTGPSAAWYPLRFLLGACINVAFIVTEVWLNTTATDEQRGRVIGLYAAAMAAGFAAGPLLLTLVGSAGTLPFLICAGLILLALLPVLPLKGAPGGAILKLGLGGVFSFFLLAPQLGLLVLVYALFDGAALVVLPLYFLEVGFGEAEAASALAVLLAGMVVLQLPLGWLLDRFPRPPVIAGCAISSAACCALLPHVLTHPGLLAGVLLLLGGLAVGLFTGALTLLGERFQGTALAAGTTAMGVVYGLGNAAGPFAAGAVLQGLGSAALPGLLAALFLFSAFATLTARHSLPQPEAGD